MFSLNFDSADRQRERERQSENVAELDLRTTEGDYKTNDNETSSTLVVCI